MNSRRPSGSKSSPLCRARKAQRKATINLSGAIALCHRHVITAFDQFIQSCLDYATVDVERYLVPHPPVLVGCPSLFEVIQLDPGSRRGFEPSTAVKRFTEIVNRKGLTHGASQPRTTSGC